MNKKLPSTGSPQDPRLVARFAQQHVIDYLVKSGISPLIASLCAKRGITNPRDILAGIEDLIPPENLKNCVEMAEILVNCREKGSRILIISDYDCDGATAASVFIEAFRSTNMNFDYLVPDREIHGYGLTPEIVNEAFELKIKPEFIITVDAGISSNSGVARANELGIKVLITDHHLAPMVLPEAELIVNPNQPGDNFASKNIAGCGVAWYVATAYFESLCRKGCDPGFEPEDLLPFVALGTIADVVVLDKNNRILVAEGLARIREGRCSYGIKALASVGKRKIPLNEMTTQDFGFSLGPRINAAGRLQSMNVGILCLTTNDEVQANRLANELDETNETRKAIQEKMVIEAERLKDPEVRNGKSYSIVVFNPDFHKGVVGIVAGRLKENYYRPAFVLTRNQNGSLVGSGRSIPGFHLKHALDELNIEYPGLLLKFGGHAMAAGVTIAPNKIVEFTNGIEEICKRHLNADLLESKLEHDGCFDPAYMNSKAIREMNGQVWGQGFPYPLFVDRINIKECQVIGTEGKHLKLVANFAGNKVNLIAFSHGHRLDDITENIVIAYQPDINTWKGVEYIQFKVSGFPGLKTANHLVKNSSPAMVKVNDVIDTNKTNSFSFVNSGLGHASEHMEKSKQLDVKVNRDNLSKVPTSGRGGLLNRLKIAKSNSVMT